MKFADLKDGLNAGSTLALLRGARDYPAHVEIHTDEGITVATKDRQGAPWMLDIRGAPVSVYGTDAELLRRLAELLGAPVGGEFALLRAVQLGRASSDDSPAG